MGLRWDIEAQHARPPGRRADLDAFCALFDARSQIVEIVHPGRIRNANASVVHTGDSTTGAKEWDDERIFVYLDALPQNVCAVVFVVISASGRVFGDVPGASCHVSDGWTEREYVRTDLRSYGFSVSRCIATLRRDPDGWKILDHAESGKIAIAAESLSLSANEKSRWSPRSACRSRAE
ncbi:MAG: TerD family protein [Betaproteobacteria bacterium]|nr:TerD family protein [Betaproteobacteria bacterium]